LGIGFARFLPPPPARSPLERFRVNLPRLARLALPYASLTYARGFEKQTKNDRRAVGWAKHSEAQRFMSSISKPTKSLLIAGFLNMGFLQVSSLSVYLRLAKILWVSSFLWHKFFHADSLKNPDRKLKDIHILQLQLLLKFYNPFYFFALVKPGVFLTPGINTIEIN